ncbi:hypothetical protein BDL97_05G056700 [Sphagnum fallax]|nr:hypothetical protein BDL97_05G056700 [Sphagnum fallax]
MEELGIKRIMLSSNAQAAPSNFLAVMKMVIGILATTVTIFTLYLSLRRCQWVAANNRHPMQQAANQNAQDIDASGIASGSTDRNGELTTSRSTDDAITNNNLSSRRTSPVVNQEVAQTSVQALELASQLTLSS